MNWRRRNLLKFYGNNLMIAGSTDISLSDILKENSVPKLFDKEIKSIEWYITHEEA